MEIKTKLVISIFISIAVLVVFKKTFITGLQEVNFRAKALLENNVGTYNDYTIKDGIDFSKFRTNPLSFFNKESIKSNLDSATHNLLYPHEKNMLKLSETDISKHYMFFPTVTEPDF